MEPLKLIASFLEGKDHHFDSKGVLMTSLQVHERHEELHLIPWREIWTSVSVARLRGHPEIVKAFFDVLLEQSVFDDRGAWSSL